MATFASSGSLCMLLTMVPAALLLVHPLTQLPLGAAFVPAVRQPDQSGEAPLPLNPPSPSQLTLPTGAKATNSAQGFEGLAGGLTLGLSLAFVATATRRRLARRGHCSAVARHWRVPVISNLLQRKQAAETITEEAPHAKKEGEEEAEAILERERAMLARLVDANQTLTEQASKPEQLMGEKAAAAQELEALPSELDTLEVSSLTESASDAGSERELAAAEPKAATLQVVEGVVVQLDNTQPEAAEPVVDPQTGDLEAVAELDEMRVTVPMSTEPEAVKPEAAGTEAFEASVPELEVAEPKPVQLETVDLDASGLEAVEAEVAELEAMGPKSVELEAVEPEAADPQAVEAEAAELEATGPDAAELEAVELEAEAAETEVFEVETAVAESAELELAQEDVQAEAAGSEDVSESVATELKSVELEIAEQETAEPDGTEPAAAMPEVAEPEAAMPEIAEQEASGPKATESREPEATDVTKPEVAELKMAGLQSSEPVAVSSVAGEAVAELKMAEPKALEPPDVDSERDELKTAEPEAADLQAPPVPDTEVEAEGANVMKGEEWQLLVERQSATLNKFLDVAEALQEGLVKSREQTAQLRTQLKFSQRLCRDLLRQRLENESEEA